MDYYCVDVESSGPTPGLHNLLSVGVTHVRRYQGLYQPFADLYVELQPIFPEFDEAAMRINKLDPIRLESEGLDPDEAMRRIVNFVHENRTSKKNDRPVFVAHNAPFDWMFFAYTCGHAGLTNPFGWSAIDTKALAMGKLNLSWPQTSLKNVRETLGNVEEMDPDQLHHAGADARHLAYVFSSLMNHPKVEPSIR